MPGAETVLTGDLSSREETKLLAADENSLRAFDSVIYKAGVYQVSGELITAIARFTLR